MMYVLEIIWGQDVEKIRIWFFFVVKWKLFYTNYACVHGKAETCEFITKSICLCGESNKVDYTDNIVSDVLIAGIYDMDIQRDIMGVEGIIDRPVNKVVSIVEKREMAVMPMSCVVMRQWYHHIDWR